MLFFGLEVSSVGWLLIVCFGEEMAVWVKLYITIQDLRLHRLLVIRLNMPIPGINRYYTCRRVTNAPLEVKKAVHSRIVVIE